MHPPSQRFQSVPNLWPYKGNSFPTMTPLQYLFWEKPMATRRKPTRFLESWLIVAWQVAGCYREHCCFTTSIKWLFRMALYQFKVFTVLQKKNAWNPIRYQTHKAYGKTLTSCLYLRNEKWSTLIHTVASIIFSYKTGKSASFAFSDWYELIGVGLNKKKWTVKEGGRKTDKCTRCLHAINTQL